MKDGEFPRGNLSAPCGGTVTIAILIPIGADDDALCSWPGPKRFHASCRDAGKNRHLPAVNLVLKGKRGGGGSLNAAAGKSPTCNGLPFLRRGGSKYSRDLTPTTFVAGRGTWSGSMPRR